MTTMSRLDPEGMRTFAGNAANTGDTARRLESAVKTIIESGSLTSGTHAPVLLNEIADETGALAKLCRDKAQQMELADIGIYLPGASDASVAAMDQLVLSLTDDVGSTGTDGWDPFVAGEVRRLLRDGAEFDDAVEAALTARQERIDTATIEVADLLAVSSQSGWTPWADGDAEVSVDEALEALHILNALTDSEAAVVLADLDPDAAERLASVVLGGSSAKAPTGWGHTAWTPIRWVGAKVDGWGETISNTVVAMFEESMRQGYSNGRGPTYGVDLGPIGPYAEVVNAGAVVMADGNVPFLSNYAGCALGDTSDCFWLAGEVAIEIGGAFVVGRVVSVVGRAGKTIFVRITGREGGHATVAITEEAAEGLLRTADGQAVDLTAELADDLAEATTRNITPIAPAIADTTIDSLVTPSSIPDKVNRGQTDRVIINMENSTRGLDDLRRQFDDWAHTVEHLKEVLVVTADGDIVRIFPEEYRCPSA